MRNSRLPRPVPIVVAALVLAASSAGGQGARRERIADPTTLMSMGFPPEAKNVFRLVPSDRAQAAPEYFGLHSGFSTAHANQVHGRSADFHYETSNGFDIFSTNPGGENFADAQVDIPNGALIEFVRVWLSDTHAVENFTFSFVEVCQPMLGAGPMSFTSLATLTSSGAPGDASLASPVGEVADSASCVYFFRIRFGNGLASGPGDSTLIAQKMRVQWSRQVSPAPVAATFPNDVPTSHPFFQFVEALATSGITAGVAPGTYGVDQPVTRGQMAVFLAVALGLGYGF